jgi:hypothetical protein
MRFLCPSGHGYQTAAQVSPDYDEALKDAFKSRCVLVRFFYNGESVDTYFLSPEFVTAEQVVPGDQPLPDDYPEWVHKVRAICSKCFTGEDPLRTSLSPSMGSC